MDRVADGLGVAAEGAGNRGDMFLSCGGEQDLATAQGEGGGRMQPGNQGIAFVIRQGANEKGCLHGAQHTTCSTTSSERTLVLRHDDFDTSLSLG
jgi:hypothetical protein